MGTAKGDGYTITPRDLELVVNAIGCTRLPFEIEYDKLSRRLGYKNAQSAKAAWNALKKKLDKVAEGAPVVPSLTIEPEPMRGTAQSSKAEGSGKKRAKQPVAQPSSETSDDESDAPPAPKLSRGRPINPRVVDDDGDVSMAENPKVPMSKSGPKSKSTKSGTKPKDPATPKGEKRRKFFDSPTSSSHQDSDNAPEAPRKKLKRKLQHLSVEDRAGAKAKRMGHGGKSVAALENEAFVAREKAFEAFGMAGAAGGGDENSDDEEVEREMEPPPAYVKKESESEGKGKA